MCRLALIKSKQPLSPANILFDFSAMAEASRAPNGDRQADGWGIALKTETGWQLHTSIKPMWRDKKVFTSFPKTKLFLVHARGASFPQEKGILEYNQPYTHGDLAFVFNGMVLGVKLNRIVPGKIGAQKIFGLLKEEKAETLGKKLTKVFELLRKSSKSFTGFNVGLSDGKNIAALCAFGQDKDYFSLHYHHSPNLAIISSEPIGNYQYSKMNSGQTINL